MTAFYLELLPIPQNRSKYKVSSDSGDSLHPAIDATEPPGWRSAPPVSRNERLP
jgi:hypothetical protein